MGSRLKTIVMVGVAAAVTIGITGVVLAAKEVIATRPKISGPVTIGPGDTVQAAAPDPPPMYPIDNLGHDSCYAVEWESVSGASEYALEEATVGSVIYARTVYTGSATSWNAVGQRLTTHHYRVEAVLGSTSLHLLC